MQMNPQGVSQDQVIKAMVVVFFSGPILALVGLYTVPMLAIAAYLIQIGVAAGYFLAVSHLNGKNAERQWITQQIEKVAHAAEQRAVQTAA